MTKKTYTFEDWKTGRISYEFEEGKIDGVVSTTYGKLEYEVYSEGYIPKKEYLKIREEQKKNFFKAVKITLECLKKDFKNKLDNSPVPDKLLDLKIEELENEIDKAKKHQLKKALTNQVSLDGIDYPVYALVQHLEFLKERDQDYLKVIHISNPSKIPDDREHERGIKYMAETLSSFKDSFETEGDFSKAMISSIEDHVSNPVYDLSVILKFLEEVKQLKTSKSLGKETGSNSGYGMHQEHRDWIIKKFNQQREIQPSQNKAVIKVKKLYREEFELSIGKTTILRMVGKAE